MFGAPRKQHEINVAINEGIARRPVAIYKHDFRADQNSCWFECDSILLGDLTKAMHVRDLILCFAIGM